MALQTLNRPRLLHLPIRSDDRARPVAPVHHATHPPVADARPLDSGALLCGTREVLIRHGSETYRLRHTRNDKLILTK